MTPGGGSLPASPPESLPASPAASPPASPAGKSPLAAAALSFVFPGAGQLYLGRRVSAAAFAVPAAVVVVWTLLQFTQGLAYFAVSLLDQSYALTVMVVAAAFTAWRVASIVHPFVVVRPVHLSPLHGGVMALLVLTTVGMGDVVVSNAYDAYAASRQIASNDFADATAPPTMRYVSVATPSFGPGNAASPMPSDTPEITPSPDPCATPGTALRLFGSSLPVAAAAPLPMTLDALAEPMAVPPGSSSPSPSPSVVPDVTASPSASASATASQGDTGSPIPGAPSESPSASPSPSPSPSPTPTPTPTPSPTPTPIPGPGPMPPYDSHRLTFLLTGVDFMTGRSHASNDTLMLVSVDLRTGAVAMVSVPRDTAAFPFYWGGRAPDNFKINSLAKAIAAGQFGSPDTPMNTLANEIGYLVGVRVNYYAEIDMDGFSQMIDLVGGVDVNNPTALNDPYTCTWVPAGLVHLDGATALRFVRSRESTSDYARASRQQLVMVALEKKLATPAMLPQLGSLLALAGQSIATNFPLSMAKDYVSVAENISSISHCVLGPPYNYHPPSSETGGTWTSRLLLDRVANLSVGLFGSDSRYYGQPEVVPSWCGA